MAADQAPADKKQPALPAEGVRQLSGQIAQRFQSSRMTPLLALVALLLGLFAVLVTPREEEPQINVTMADILVPYPGASVDDVETLVATPGEQVLSRMSGVEHVYSVSRPGMAVLTVQFAVGIPYQDAVVRLHDTVQSHRDWFPAHVGVGEPVVKPRGIDDVPIVALTFSTADPQRSAHELQQVARSVEIELKRVAGTRDVSALGGPEQVLRVSLDPGRMSGFGITPADVAQALQAGNARETSGHLVESGREWRLQTGDWLESIDDVRQLVVGVRGEGGARKAVMLADVAAITQGPDQPRTYVWHGTQAGDAPAVTLQVSKKPGVNAADVAAAVIRRVDQLQGSVIPEGIEVTVTRNYGKTATEKAEQLIGKLAFATAFVVMLVWLALGWREALIVGVAVSLTLAATLFASWAWGFTLNRVSLFALIFSIGILVDDAIVVVENIHRWQQLYPRRRLLEIIPAAVDEVGGPTILATMTVIAALLPMAFVSGLMGPYMSPIPINASLGMAISLAIAFVITPWLAARWLKPAPGHGADETEGARPPRLQVFFATVLGPFLQPCHGAWARRGLYLVLMLLIAGSVALAAVQWVVLKMLPFDNKSEFQVVLDMPAGTSLETTAEVLRAMGQEVVKVPEVTHYQAYAGTASPINFNGLVRQYYLRASSERGDLQVNLVGKNERRRQSHEIAVSVREAVMAVARARGGNAKVVEVPPGPPVLSPIVAEIYGPDEPTRQGAATILRQVLEQTPDVLGVDDSLEASTQEQWLKVLQPKAALMGVSQAQITQALRLGLAGEDVTPLRNAGSRYGVPVRVALPATQQRLDTLLQLKVRAGSGRLVALSELVATQTVSREAARYHKDLLPVTYVVADMGGALDSPLYGMFAARKALAEQRLDGNELGEWFIHAPTDPYAGPQYKWDGEWQVTYETFRDMGLAYAVGLVLIYLLVVAHFGSYLMPLIIMAPIPLTVIGVMPGHALFGAPFTATSMIGMIALAGIIVRNSILLVDFVRGEVAAGSPLREAIIESAAVRAKPIALTALAAMLGAFFILDDPIFNGLAISLIFGILVSTLLTLVVIPVLYYAAFHKESRNEINHER